MAPIDYSKWDNIDTDSEPETSPQQPPAPKANTPPAPKANPPPAPKANPPPAPKANPSPAPKANPPPAPAASQSAASASAATHSPPGSIQAVIVRCEVEKRAFLPWSATAIPADHPVFSQPVPPVPALIEVPLVLHRVGTRSA